MNIVINSLSALRGGGQTYILNLLRELSLINADFKVILITNSKNTHVFEKFKSENISIYEAKFASKNIIFRVFWEIFILHFLLRKQNVKAYFSPGGIMLTPVPKGCKSYTALRNMLPFDERERKRFPFFSYIRFKLWILKHVFLVSYKLSDGVVFISKHSQEEVEKYLPKIKEKSTIIYHGLNEDFFNPSEDTLPIELEPGAYYLYVSILDVYKAQKEIVESWLEMNKQGNNLPLILVGPKYNEYGENVVSIINESGASNIKYLGPIEYPKLPNIYQKARGLIFGSSCECCPNILLEKLASGRPVISSNIMPMPEFGQNAAVYFDPYEKGSLASAIKYLEESDNINKHSILSKNRAEDFSWKKTTEKTFNFLMKS